MKITHTCIIIPVIFFLHILVIHAQPPVYQTGWPQDFGFQVWDVTNMVNLDHSGNLEVIGTTPTSGKLQIKNADGTNFSGWPQTFSFTNYGPAVTGDVDGDGDDEIFLGAHNGYQGVLLGWDDAGNYLPGFPYYFPATSYEAKPVLFDLDNNGDLEIILSPANSDSTYVLNHDGTLFPGWPQFSSGTVFDAPAVADLDGDGLPEIIAGADSLYAWRTDGTPVQGFPVNLDMFYVVGIAVGDLDHDGDCEIVITGPTLSFTNNIFVFNNDGTVASGWPKLAGPNIGKPALGDLDDDGDLEIVSTSFGSANDTYLFAFNYDGTNLTGWPAPNLDGGFQNSAAIGDIDSDGHQEVIAGSDNHKLYAYHADATMVADWPLSGPNDQLSAPVSLADVDLDGDIEASIGCLDNKVYIWDISGKYDPAHIDWQTYHHDAWFTGWFHPWPPKNLQAVDVGNYVSLSWQQNPEPDVNGYNVYRSDSNGSDFQKINSQLVTTTDFMDTTAASGETYLYTVTAHIRAGSESRYSSKAEVTVATSTENMIAEGDGKLILHLWPNPAHDKFRVGLDFGSEEDSKATIRISNLQCQTVFEESLFLNKNLKEKEIVLSPFLTSGVYSVEVITATKVVLGRILLL
ncbi:MAG TPA: FG-GAP-like repeat-containing protein [Chitinophagales bacterium]|nr:FG-GAP-like repeat-containing protein [Chitinophagales bacterium]